MTKSTKTLKSQAKQAPTPVAQSSDLLTIAEVAQILRVDGTTVRRWAKQGALEAVILPHPNERQAYRIKRSTLNKILGTASHAK
jgi:excisionase family DNA binding protein